MRRPLPPERADCGTPGGKRLRGHTRGTAQPLHLFRQPLFFFTNPRKGPMEKCSLRASIALCLVQNKRRCPLCSAFCCLTEWFGIIRAGCGRSAQGRTADTAPAFDHGEPAERVLSSAEKSGAVLAVRRSCQRVRAARRALLLGADCDTIKQILSACSAARRRSAGQNGEDVS